MSSFNGASLLDSSLHSPQIFELLELDVGRNFIEHIVQTTTDTVDSASSISSPLKSRRRSGPRKHSEFTKFVSNTVTRSEARIGVLLVALVYIHRAKHHLSIDTEDWACHRVFLGALILASKYTNDSTLRNVHWSHISGVFGKRDIGRIEREFLDVLDWELGFTESDILSHHHIIMSLYPQPRYQLMLHRASDQRAVRYASQASSLELSSSSTPSTLSLRTPTSPPPPPLPTKPGKLKRHVNTSFRLSHIFTRKGFSISAAVQILV